MNYSKAKVKSYKGMLVRVIYYVMGYKQDRTGTIEEVWENHFTFIIEGLSLKIQYKYVESIEPLNLKK